MFDNQCIQKIGSYWKKKGYYRNAPKLEVIFTVFLSVAFIVASFYVALFFRKWKHKRGTLNMHAYLFCEALMTMNCSADLELLTHERVSLRGGSAASGISGFGMIHFNRGGQPAGGGGGVCHFPGSSPILSSAKVRPDFRTSFGPPLLKQSVEGSPVLPPFKVSQEH